MVNILLSNDSLWLISRRFGVKVADIKRMNSLTSTVLQIGQVLILRDGTSIVPTHTTTGTGTTDTTTGTGTVGTGTTDTTTGTGTTGAVEAEVTLACLNNDFKPTQIPENLKTLLA